MSSMLFSSQPITPSPLSRALAVDGDVLEHVRVRAVKHDLPPRNPRSRSSSQSSVSSSSSFSSGATSPNATTTISPDKRQSYGDFINAFLPSSPNYHYRPPFSRRGSMSSIASVSSEDDQTITPIRLIHAVEPSRDIAQAFNESKPNASYRDSTAPLAFPRLTPPGSPSPYLAVSRRGSAQSLASRISRESLRRPQTAVSLPTEDLYYTPPQSPFSAARRALQASDPGPIEEEEDITACYNVLGFKGFGL
ncbi:unnamed protein product [Peniophora sp. CBMAI 1063]|nr:unnamed protein product [Peniophora sp. CBMAI 1063]